jgi:hypothetical protein
MAELRGQVPKLPFAFTKTLVNRAWREIRESNLWSFNLIDWAWITPPPIMTGTATYTQGSPTVQFDTTAQAAIAAFTPANPYALVTQLQFRGGNVAGISGIYNLIAYDSGTGIGTLDKIYADPSGSASQYTLFQDYYVPPVKDFLTLISVRNMQMFLYLELNATRGEIDERDPQRSWYEFPTYAVPFEVDQRGVGTANASATLGYMMFELWGVPITPFTYQCYGLRRGTDLVAPTDTLPYQIGEDLVLARAKYYAYQWAESNKDMSPRSTGPDFKFLMQAANAEYKQYLIRYRRDDREAVTTYMSKHGPEFSSRLFGYYNTIAGVAGPYGQY